MTKPKTEYDLIPEGWGVFHEYNIVTNDDGIPLIFLTKEEAEEYAVNDGEYVEEVNIRPKSFREKRFTTMI